MRNIIIAKDNIGVILYKLDQTVDEKIIMKLFLFEKYNENPYTLATYVYDLIKDEKKVIFR